MRRLVALGVFAVGVTLAISGVGIMSVSATPPSPTHRLVICHTTGSTSTPYVQLEVDIPSSDYLDGGHSGHRDDIIPPYTYGAFRYAGKNWTAQGQTIWLAGCALTAGASVGGTAATVSAPTPAPSAGVHLAASEDTGASEVIGIILSTIGFLAMGLGLIGYRRRQV
jgi:hypothetical protein